MTFVPGGRKRSDSGTALVEMTWLGLLLLVPLVYLVLAVFDVQRASFGVSAATRAAGRAYVLAPDVGSAQARAAQAAAVALRDQGLDLDAGALAVSCLPGPGSCLQPRSSVRVSLSVEVPLPMVPDALGGGALSVRVSSTHLAPYGTYREGR